MQRKKWGNEYRSTRVCIDQYTNRVPEGRFYNQYCPEGVRFKGLVEMLEQMDDMLNRMQFPQSFVHVRSFAEATVSEGMLPDRVTPREGDCATFDVRVLFRQNASWQGTIIWREGGKEANFRSVLELISLMNSALCAEGESE